MNSSSKLKSKFELERREYLEALHLKAQTRTSKIMAPIFLTIFIIVLISDYSWQMVVVLSTMVITFLSLQKALSLSRQKRIESAAIISLVGMMIVTTVANVFIEGILPSTVASYMASIIHSSLYNRKASIIGMGIAATGYITCVLMQYFRPIEIIQLAPSTELMVNLTTVLLLSGQVMVYIFQAYDINRFLINNLKDVNYRQEVVLQTVDEIQPIINGAIEQISTISSEVAAQADKQATATAEVSATAAEVMQIAEQTARAAAETELIADRTRAGIEKNSYLHQGVERSFKDVVIRINAARKEIFGLVSQVERIEEILKTNQSIGEHIKVLSVNAAIEAAKAGEFGRGFQIVATELRDMIRSTEKNLGSSHRLLEEIRVRSRESSIAIKDGANQLDKYNNALKATDLMISDSTQGFLKTAAHVKQISTAAGEQQTGMREMSFTMRKLDAAAGDLNNSAIDLQSVVNTISDSQNRLNNALNRPLSFS